MRHYVVSAFMSIILLLTEIRNQYNYIIFITILFIIPDIIVTLTAGVWYSWSGTCHWLLLHWYHIWYNQDKKDGEQRNSYSLYGQYNVWSSVLTL